MMFNVTITEILKKTVKAEANDRQEAEQAVYDEWRTGKYILDADNFVEVKIEAE